MLWSAFLIGFLGSFHCIGMCGPILLSLPKRGNSYKLFYNLGRTLTYTFLGLAAGLVGQGLAFVGLQQILSITIGVIMFIIIVFTKYKYFNLPTNGLLNNLYTHIKFNLGLLFKSKLLFSAILIGMLNGLLPCGLVYAALFAALSIVSFLGGAYYMFFFGLGTIPIMLGFGVFFKFITTSFRSKLTKTIPYFLILVAILLILRGLNLGIPYVSPKIDNSGKMHCTINT
jgi:sulfite exporter TauE/SafE